MAKKNLLMAFYGDDFTGATDAMEWLTRDGVHTVLFVDPPTPEQTARFKGLQAVGIAGVTRALSPDRMEEALTPAMEHLRDIHPPVVHYKTCSTFDSSPEIGSIGKAIDVGKSVLGSPVIPLLVGAPMLGRYLVFGNLFARSGLDSEPYRLDRHPTMSQHPITPMNESDLRMHLAKQTDKTIGLVDILAIGGEENQARKRMQELIGENCEIILIDLLYQHQVSVAGDLIWQEAVKRPPLFVAGSSAVECALCSVWEKQGILPKPKAFRIEKAEQMVVLSGSCSPVTNRQIERALSKGIREVDVSSEKLIDPESASAQIQTAIQHAVEELEEGRSVIIHSCRGPEDPRLEATRRHFEHLGHDDTDTKLASGKTLGRALGQILAGVLQRRRVPRVCVTGGDTSGYVARTLEIEALEMIGPVAPGCPLCHIYAEPSWLDGMEICFKGGQVGTDDFFDIVMDPGLAN